MVFAVEAEWTSRNGRVCFAYYVLSRVAQSVLVGSSLQSVLVTTIKMPSFSDLSICSRISLRKGAWIQSKFPRTSRQGANFLALSNIVTTSGAKSIDLTYKL
jgi:hypothetical protein